MMTSRLLLVCLFPVCLSVGESPAEGAAAELLPEVQVDAEGVFLHQLVRPEPGSVFPAIRLADAPPLGTPLVLDRRAIAGLLRTQAPEWSGIRWTGAPQTSVSRRVRALAQDDVRSLLTEALETRYATDDGELDLRFTRPWTDVTVPDEPLEVTILDMPSSGLGSYFIVRFELKTAHEVVGAWQAAFEARLWKEVLVAAEPLRRGQVLQPYDLAKEKRDVLSLRNAVTSIDLATTEWELTQNLTVGTPLSQRALREKPMVLRGQTVDAVIRDGSLFISMKVQLLEDGRRGEEISARNPQSRRIVRGKVYDEQTIYVSL